MKKNMSRKDRLIRLSIAALIGIMYYFGTISGVAGTIMLVIAIVFFLTSLIRSCPFYAVLGINTCDVESKAGM